MESLFQTRFLSIDAYRSSSHFESFELQEISLQF